MNKICVVMGAGNAGIGQAVTDRMLQMGWSVIGTYDNDTDLGRLQSINSDSLSTVKVDYSSRNGLDSLFECVGDRNVEALINVQMFFEIENPEDLNFDGFDRSVFVNLSAPNYIIHKMKKNFVAGSSITIVTSTEGFIGSYGASAYAATKAAIHNIVKTHANNLGKKGVRCNAVAPGWIGGVMDTDEVFNLSRKITPLGRLGAPEEVASVIAFLSSSDASFVNGTVIVVDGGYSGVDTISKYEFENGNL